MAKRKKGGRKRNSARVGQRPAAYKKAAPAKRNPGRKRGGFKMRNPLGGSVGGLKVSDLAGGAIGLIVGETVNTMFPGWLGIGLQFGGALVIARVLPKGLGPAASLVMGANAAKNTINRFIDVSGLVQRSVQGLLPAQGATSTVGATQSSGVVSY